MKGVKFAFMHSFDSFGLILNSKEIGSTEIKKNLIEIAGVDGYLDATYFFRELKYTNRTLIFHFTISSSVGINDYLSTYNNVNTILHGTKRKIILDEDAETARQYLPQCYLIRPTTGTGIHGNINIIGKGKI